ncbi:MAG: Gfo/Idh/MocA family oxidoreductase [Armatimonadetes bacterium]|nr:Gfo/Idh/MocA family oxidoreductase [Armatimonadota bacterium]
MAKLGAAVIGANMGAGHAVGYVNNPHTELRAVCDLNLESAQRLAAAHGAAVATANWEELLRRDDIQIVSVATPDPLHAPMTVACLEAGKHVLCEKPMALTLPECEEMIAAADRTGKLLMVGQVCRFAPGFRLTKHLIERGEIGELFFVESEYAHDYTHAVGAGNWRKDPKIKREPFVGGACHAVDLVRWIAGNMVECFAYSNHKVLTDWPVDDCTIATYKFENGVIGKVMCSIGCKRPYTMRSVFYGSKGTIISDNTSPSIQLYTQDLPTTLDWITLPVNLASHNVAAEIDELVACIVEGRPLATDGREGARTVAACRAAVESAATGKPVAVRTEF